MKLTHILPLLSLATAIPLLDTRDPEPSSSSEINNTTLAMSPSISLSQAAAMGSIHTLNTLSTTKAAAAAAAGPINEYGLDGPCKAVTVLFAKGTGENGNMGDGSSPGPAWAAAIRASLGTDRVAVQGIAYDASVLGYLLGGSPSGSTTYLNTINQASTKCPSTKIVIGGYSQGAQILHNAAEKLTAAVTAKIAAAVLFGDPDYPDTPGSIPASKTLQICHQGDIICRGIGGADAHLTYPSDAPQAAAFVAARV
ncbi:separase/separin, variant 2 [Cadophora gregata]|nr:separase/separin, variant 2 [Cadophora gregata]KAK0109467.1 separase/separin, variant 2 [Cadophora gregata]KAK0110905.1 separase/separin [Cadophora gregata f. sp. sojae]